MMDAYAQRRGISVNGLRFTLDGTRIAPDDTPKMVTLISFIFILFIYFMILIYELILFFISLSLKRMIRLIFNFIYFTLNFYIILFLKIYFFCRLM